MEEIPKSHPRYNSLKTREKISKAVINGIAHGNCDKNLRYDHNSYSSPDSTNQIDWNWKIENIEVFNYYKGLIDLRKNTNVFAYKNANQINDKIKILHANNGLISYIITDKSSPWKYTYVIYNNSIKEREVSLLGEEWNLVVNKDFSGTTTIKILKEKKVTVMKNETLVMYR